MSSKVRSGMSGTDQVCQVRSGQGNVLVRTASDQVRSRQGRTGYVKIKSDQVRQNKIRSGQDRSGMVK